MRYISFLALFFSASVLYGQTDTTLQRTRTKVDIRLDKGNFLIGGTVSLDLRENSNKDQLVRKINIENLASFAVRLDGGYAIKDDVFAGIGLQYGQTDREGDYINSSDGTLSNVKYFEQSISIRPFIKNHLPLDRRGRFNIVNQTELKFQIDQSISETTIDRVVTRTLSVDQAYGVGIRPGIMVFVVHNFAFEATVNLAGISYSHSRVETTGQPDMVVSKAGIDLKIDLLQLNLGFLIYL
jgi:hypothetical protein